MAWILCGPAVKESIVLWPGSCVWAGSQGEYSAVAWILCLGLQSRRVQCCGLDPVSGPAVKENIVLWPGSQCEPGIGLCFVRPVAQ